MTVTKEPSAKAEVKALRALVLAMAWQAMNKAPDPAAYTAELRDLAEETRSAIPARHCEEAWPALADMLGDIDKIARVVMVTPPA